MLVDFHMHSKYSFDAKKDSIDSMAKSAINKGISHIAITDHQDFFKKRQDVTFDIASQQRDIDKARSEYDGEVCILKGIEIGQINARSDGLELAKAYPFDMVIGSFHAMPNDSDFYEMDYTKINCDELMKEYLTELLKMVKCGGFNVLAHIDYPMRKMENADFNPTFEPYMEYLTPVLKEIISRDIALELNAAGLFCWLNQAGLEGIVLEEYKRLGGEMISLGSDSHSAQDMGRGIKECIRQAKKYGFNKVTMYKNRKPYMLEFGEEM